MLRAADVATQRLLLPHSLIGCTCPCIDPQREQGRQRDREGIRIGNRARLVKAQFSNIQIHDTVGERGQAGCGTRAFDRFNKRLHKLNIKAGAVPGADNADRDKARESSTLASLLRFASLRLDSIATHAINSGCPKLEVQHFDHHFA